MKILIVGTEENLKECKTKFGESHTYQLVNHSQVAQFLGSEMVVFDFDPIDVSIYNQKDLVVFLNSVKTSLTQLIAGKVIQGSVFGFCGMPSFLNREIFEVTTLGAQSATLLEKICSQLNTNFKIVEDRVGMITPRIICMIINEAYFANEENVASRTDIDLAMKLGTNYPFGPFEWSEKIGIRNVYELLNAVYNDTKDERYKICDLLKKEALA
jgi:3-hydroxybutyryl-CoA dehydrogenase